MLPPSTGGANTTDILTSYFQLPELGGNIFILCCSLYQCMLVIATLSSFSPHFIAARAQKSQRMCPGSQGSQVTGTESTVRPDTKAHACLESLPQVLLTQDPEKILSHIQVDEIACSFQCPTIKGKWKCVHPEPLISNKNDCWKHLLPKS